MVKIAIAGATSGVAREVIDALAETDKHDILLLSRSAIPADQLAPGVTSVQADYTDENKLVQILTGIHTVLSFIFVSPGADPKTRAVPEKSLINAALKAGVKRYAPSEWASHKFDHMPWYGSKAEIRQYLADLNKDSKVLEYCLFQPGLFVNYFAAPYKTSKHVYPFQMMRDFNGRRAIMVEGTDGGQITLITIQDFAKFIVRAVGYEGEWPVVGGLSGNVLTVRQLMSLGEKLRGPFSYEEVSMESLNRGELNTSWMPLADHPGISVEERRAQTQLMTAGILLAFKAATFHSTNEWNKLLPDLEFTGAEEFLTKAWEGKP